MSTDPVRPRAQQRSRSAGVVLAGLGAAALGLVVTELTSTLWPLAIGVLVALVTVGLALFRRPASPARRVVRTAGVLVVLGLLVLVGAVVMFLTASGGDSLGSFFLAVAGLAVVGTGLVVLVVAGVVRLVSSGRGH